MNIRLYQPSDFRAVLALINDAADSDHTKRQTASGFQSMWGLVPSEETYAQSAVATQRDGTIIGFAWWDARSLTTVQIEGWVHVNWRRKGVGTALLTALDLYVRRYGRGQVELVGRAFADLPGTAELFQLKGYRIARQFYILGMRLQGRQYEPISLPSDIVLRSFHAGDLEKLVAADNDFFAGHWGSHPRNAAVWKQHMIERRPHDPHLWTLAWANDEIVGECLCHASQQGGPNDAYIANVGVRQDWRGRGLGRAMMLRGCEKLQEAGFDHAQLSVDIENIPALGLYCSLGMEVVRTRNHFSKMIDTIVQSML